MRYYIGSAYEIQGHRPERNRERHDTESMIQGIGIDMIEVQRVEEKISKEKGFREHVFSKNEIQYCDSQKNSYQNYAARFAAKEAFLKALGIGLVTDFQLNEIEITNEPSGKPVIQFIGEAAELIQKYNLSHIHVSLTHLKAMASAVVLIEK